MQPVLSVAAMRTSDAVEIEKGTPSRVLMARAGRGIFESYPWHGHVTILCGSGNNAGDGYVLAQLLKEAGVFCELILCSDRFSPDGAYYYRLATKASVPVRKEFDFSHTDVLADCLLGTGFHGQLREPYKTAVERGRACGCEVVAVDIASGLNGDTGEGVCIPADLTVSIGFLQPGHLVALREGKTKKVRNVDIGIPVTGKFLPFYEPWEEPIFDPAIHEIISAFSAVLDAAMLPGNPAKRLQAYGAALWGRLEFAKIE